MNTVQEWFDSLLLSEALIEISDDDTVWLLNGSPYNNSPYTLVYVAITTVEINSEHTRVNYVCTDFTPIHSIDEGMNILLNCN